jgi:hypothetical protein
MRSIAPEYVEMRSSARTFVEYFFDQVIAVIESAWGGKHSSATSLARLKR